MEQSLEAKANFMRPGLTSGALWILCRAEHGLCETHSTASSPEAVDRTNLRGLIKRGLISERSDNGIYNITALGKVILERFRRALSQ